MKRFPSELSRRQFLGGAITVTAAASLSSVPLRAASAGAPAAIAKPPFTHRIKLGVIGNGGRGGWIAKLFQAHGGFDLWSVADYFPEVVEKCGGELGVDRSRRFSTLSGYQRLIASGVEAVVVETPPYFIPEHVTAAVAAGLHVYMAKPVASDVPGALRVEAAGKLATRHRRCFLVDYQLPTDPINIEVATRIRDGGLGKIVRVVTTGHCGPQKDPPKTRVGVTFSSRQFDAHGTPGGILNRMFGSNGVLMTAYGGDVLIRGEAETFYRGGKTSGIYQEGAVANIRGFHEQVMKKDATNATVAPSVTSNLVAIMGRMAAYEGRPVTWQEVSTSKNTAQPDLSGLKA